MPVFLSYRLEDKQETLLIADYLKQHNINCYIDLFDSELQSTDDITKKLLDRIGRCTHLITMVSGYSEKSWWVPFEIGVGADRGRRIISYQLKNKKLPGFLKKWPILKSRHDLDTFIDLYKQDTIVSASESYGYPKNISSAEQFHLQLKANL